ncbi:zinc finger and BTB domain-containing protein 6-like [Xenentodon cancila]
MSSSCDTLRFTFPHYGDFILCKINLLREEHHFCDITLILGNPDGSTAQPLRFHGHRVVLAASSDFLRDQFLLHEGQAELNVGAVSSVRIANSLLLSCYTGLLEVPLKEVVNYLTASSALQMSHVVEKCIQAISQYLSPTPAFLKLEIHCKDKESQQLVSSWTSSSFENQREKDVVQPNARIWEANAQTGETVGQSQPELKTSQEGVQAVTQELKVIKEDTKVVNVKRELLETLFFDTLKSEESRGIKPFCNPSLHVHHTSTSLKCNLHPPVEVQDLVSSTASNLRSAGDREVLMEAPPKQHEQVTDEPTEDSSVCTLVHQLQQGTELMDSKQSGHSGAGMSKNHMIAEDAVRNPEDESVQRPYLCRRCDKLFQHLENYKCHLKEHRRFFCLVCGEGFSHKSKLIHHINIHTSTKPFRCPLCHKMFTQKALLQDHLHLHTGQGPHKWAQQLKSSLTDHLSDSSLPDKLKDGGAAALA